MRSLLVDGSACLLLRLFSSDGGSAPSAATSLLERAHFADASSSLTWWTRSLQLDVWRERETRAEARGSRRLVAHRSRRTSVVLLRTPFVPTALDSLRRSNAVKELQASSSSSEAPRRNFVLRAKTVSIPPRKQGTSPRRPTCFEKISKPSTKVEGTSRTSSSFQQVSPLPFIFPVARFREDEEPRPLNPLSNLPERLKRLVVDSDVKIQLEVLQARG